MPLFGAGCKLDRREPVEARMGPLRVVVDPPCLDDRAMEIQNKVDALYAGRRFWPEPLIQLNPHYAGGGSMQALVGPRRGSAALPRGVSDKCGRTYALFVIFLLDFHRVAHADTGGGHVAHGINCPPLTSMTWPVI